MAHQVNKIFISSPLNGNRKTRQDFLFSLKIFLSLKIYWPSNKIHFSYLLKFWTVYNQEDEKNQNRHLKFAEILLCKKLAFEIQ